MEAYAETVDGWLVEARTEAARARAEAARAKARAAKLEAELGSMRQQIEQLTQALALVQAESADKVKKLGVPSTVPPPSHPTVPPHRPTVVRGVGGCSGGATCKNKPAGACSFGACGSCCTKRKGTAFASGGCATHGRPKTLSRFHK